MLTPPRPHDHGLAPACLALTLLALACSDSGDPEDSTTANATTVITSTASATGTSAAATQATSSGVTTTGATTTGATATGAATAGVTTDDPTTGGDEDALCPPGLEGLTPELAGASALDVGAPPQAPWESFLEGPVWAEGGVFVSQIRTFAEPGGHSPARILKYTPGVGFAVFREDGGTNGLARRPAGPLLGASQAAQGLIELDAVDGGAPVTPIVTSYMGAGFNSPNDLTLHANGTLYFTDPKWQCEGAGCGQGGVERAYRVDPRGVVSEIPSAPQTPNGISLSPDHKTLYVGGLGPLTAYPVTDDGALGAGAPFGGLSGVDGMAIDCAGNIYATDNDGVIVLSPAGETVGVIAVEGSTTNAAFGGADGRTLYVTTMFPEGLHELALELPGLPY